MSEEDNTVSGEAGVSMPDEAIARQVVAAAERGDRFAFTVAASRLGSLEEAQHIVRSRAIVRSVDRHTAPAGVEVAAGVEIRDAAPASADGESDVPTMFGHFAVFKEWTEINSYFEGNFLERIAPGAFKKTFRENRDAMRSLFQHGMDPQIGDKPLGPIDVLQEDERGAYYEVPLLDASYVRDEVLPGLEAGLYGASFRFSTLREEFVEEPGVSAENPKGLPERTLKELRVFEFGPVTFPAYPSATAGVRSQEVVPAPASEGAETEQHPAPVGGAAAGSHSVQNVRRGQPIYGLNRKETPSWLL